MTRKSERRKWISLLLQLAAIALVIWGLMQIVGSFAIGEVRPDFEIPMANQHIEWTGAGYDGIWRH